MVMILKIIVKMNKHYTELTLSLILLQKKKANNNHNNKSSWSWQIQIEDCLPKQILAYQSGCSKEVKPQGWVSCWTCPSSGYTGYSNDMAILGQKAIQATRMKAGQSEKDA